MFTLEFVVKACDGCILMLTVRWNGVSRMSRRGGGRTARLISHGVHGGGGPFTGKEPEWYVYWVCRFCYDSSDKHLHDSGDNKCLWLAAVYVATIHLDNNEKPIPKMVWEITSKEDGCWRHLGLKLMSIHSCHFPNIYFSKLTLLLSHRTSTKQNIDVMISFETLFEAGDFHSSCRCQLIDVWQRRYRKQMTFDQIKLPVHCDWSSCEHCFSH